MTLNRELGLSPEVIRMMQMMGVELPENVKEITTETVEDETTRQIIIPKGMDKLEASKELKKQWENEEQEIDLIAEFDTWNWKDVLVTIKKVTEETFGWLNAKSGWGNPIEIDVVVDVKDGKNITEKAFLGDFKITTWANATAEIGLKRDGSVYLRITCKRKYSSEVTQYFNLLRDHLKANSIYKGRSIVVTAGEKEGTLDFEIIEVKTSDKIFLNEEEESVVNTFVIDTLGDPGKRTTLFTGDYGNGKTEMAMKVGKVAVEKHNMAFFYLKDAKLFDKVLNSLKQYAPAVLFVEDIDEIAGNQDRDAVMNKILNTLDGVQTKGMNLKTIFTTNHIHKLNAAIRRPGRIDLIVRFQNPNKETVKKIFNSYLQNLPCYEGLDMEHIVSKTPEAQGAVIAEIAKRMVDTFNKRGNLTTENAIACVSSMKYQVELMQESTKPQTNDEKFVESFKSLVYNEAFSALEDH